MDRLGVIASHLSAGTSIQQPSMGHQRLGGSWYAAPEGRLVIVVGGAVLDIQASADGDLILTCSMRITETGR